MCSLDTAIIELIPINPFINDENLLSRQEDAENVKVKIKFPYSLFLSDVNRSFEIILDGVEFRKRFSMRLRIPAASTFAVRFMRRVEGRQSDVFDTVTTVCQAEAKSSMGNRIVGTRFAIGEWPNCSRNVRVCSLIQFARASHSFFEQCFPKRTCGGFNAIRNKENKTSLRFQISFKYK